MCVFYKIISCLVLLLPALYSAQNLPGFFISAPDVIRVGVSEKVLISVHNTEGTPVRVSLLLQSYPSKAITYDHQNITIQSDQPQIVTLQVNPDNVDIASKKDINQYATLVVKSDSEQFPFERKKDILLSYKSGYVFIQTDKPIYTPEHKVSIRVISLDQQMKPSNVPIKLEIRNPQHIVVKQMDSALSDTGFIEETFQFPSHPVFGNWSVVAFYGHKQQHNTSVQFLVREYVLPTFSVKIKPLYQYLLPGDDNLLVTLEAKTTYGEPVQGLYHIKYSILLPSGELLHRYSMPSSIRLESDGRVTAELKTMELGYDWANEFRGARLHIHASITEESSGITEATSNIQTMIVDTPYQFKRDNTVRYFKKGLPFEVKVDVQYANGQAVGNRLPVNAVVRADIESGGEIRQVYSGQVLTNTAGQITFQFDVPEDATKLRVELATANSAISDMYNTQTNFDVNPQQSSRTGSYLMAQILTQKIEVGWMQVELKRINKPGNTTLHMFVVSKGQIVSHKTTSSIDNSVTVDIDVTVDMVPHARLIAYFVDGQNQVVADSVWFYVDHSCEVELSTTPGTTGQQDTKYKPKNEIELQVTGDPGTQVGLLAIDSSLFLLQDNKITDKKMTKKMDDYDLGCGPGGGVDVAAVFMDSGITVITNADLSTDRRQDETCEQSSARRRRDTANSLANQYPQDPVLQTYCNIGAADHWRNSTACLMDAEEMAATDVFSSVDERIQAVQAYYNCCMMVNFEDEDEKMEEEEDELVRSDFPETWIYDQVKINEYGSTVYSIAIPDSATTWVIQAVGVSSAGGMCVANKVEVRVQPDVFIQLHMPYTVVRKEQIEIVGTVYNYLDETLEANVSIFGVDGLCSETAPGEWSMPRLFDIPANDAVTVKFNVVPLGVGEFPVEIRVQTTEGNDTIHEMITVVPEGIEKIDTIQVNVNPSRSNHQTNNLISQRRSSNSNLIHEHVSTGSFNYQKDHINITLPAGTVPDSAVLKMHVSGDLMGHAVKTVIEGQSLESNLNAIQDINNGELATADTAYNVYIMKYLQETRQLTTDVTQTLQQNIESGVTTQYNYRRENTGAFAFQEFAPDSIWLTAFANKVLCHAHEFHSIDPTVTSTASDWLISRQQQDGGFFEDLRVNQPRIRGALIENEFGNHRVAMTAYVLISLLECNSTALQSHTAIQDAVSYLQDNHADLDRPYDLAIVTYALALVGSPSANAVNERLSDRATFDEDSGTYHWEEEMSDAVHRDLQHWYAISIETTGYALLAQLQLGAISYSHNITKWLSQQRNYNGGFVQVQDTVIALQALSRYALWSRGEKTNLNMTFTNDMDHTFNHMVHIHPGNVLLQHTIHGPVDGQIMVNTKGTGTAQLAVQLKYNTIEDSPANCKFLININAGVEGSRSRRSAAVNRRHKRQSNRGKLVSYVEVCTRYMWNAASSGTAVIDVGLYSGFRPLNKGTLDEVLSNHSGTIQRYEITNRSVIFYVEQISSAEELCFSFETIRDYVVGKPQPVAVRVYEYEQPDMDCVKFYHPESGVATLSAVCEGQTCICAAAKCPTAPCDANPRKPRYCNTSYEQLLNAMCPVETSNPKAQSTFAYEVSFNSRHSMSGGFEITNMNILSAFVIGNDTALQRSLIENPNRTVVRQFWRSLNCQRFGTVSAKQGGGLITTRNYLVIGTGGLRYWDENGNESFKYILDDTYIFEDWPTNDRALREWYQPQLEKLESLRTAMSAGGVGCMSL